MTSQRFPEGVVLSKADIAACDLPTVLADTSDEYHSIHSACSAAAKQAIKDNRPSVGKALWLLADACSMYMNPESRNDPFGPPRSFGDRRTAIPSDFAEEDIDWFASILSDLEDPLLRARIADIVWMKKKSHGITVPRCAIDAYRKIPIETDQEWVIGGGDCWRRALALAKSLGGGAETRVSEMETELLSRFEHTTEEHGYLLLRIADLLREFSLGESRAADIANRLSALASHFSTGQDFHRARDYHQGAVDWHLLAGNEELALDQTAAIAEAYAQEAELRTVGEHLSNMVAASFLENAIQTFRTIPRQHRPSRKVDERIAELHVLMSKAGAAALGEMETIQSEGIDISDLVQHSQESVRDKPIAEALLAFISLNPLMNYQAIRRSVEEKLKQPSLRHLFSSTHFSRDGRCIAKTPGAEWKEGSQGAHESLIRREMLQRHQIQMQLRIQGTVLPAWRELQLAHHLNQHDFIHIAQHSPIVPPGRARSWGKALFFGYDGDWGTALHLLVPQIEHMVRFHLKEAGAKTTNLDQQGIENEYGMSTLMEMPEAETVFGPDLRFELQALFCDPLGPNLRNELAHGLLADDVGRSFAAIYAWWFALKLVYIQFWNAARRSDEDQTHPESQEEPSE